MRRRKKTLDGKVWDGGFPAELVVFDPERWPGDEPWERWDAWWQAGIDWADKTMPNGHDELWQEILRYYDNAPPDRPWNEAEI